jgi:hypothetical protein
MSVACALAVGACRASLPQPAGAPQPDNAFVDVPYPPPPARVEAIPPRPRADALWIDGQWSWGGDQWDWWPGGWVAPVAGARFARWELRLQADGRLKFAAPSWRDPSGRELPAPPLLAVAQGEGASETPVRCP